MAEMPEGYPDATECERQTEVGPESIKIGHFLDWLVHDKGYVIAEYRVMEECYPADQLVPVRGDFNKLLADYYNIDLNKVEEERRAILAFLRTAHEDKDAPKVRVLVNGEDLDEE